MVEPSLLSSIEPRPVRLFSDARGVLWKAVDHGEIPDPGTFGEIYVIHTLPGAARGNHLHRRTSEWFVVLQGAVRCRLALPDTEERKEVVLESSRPVVLRVPPGVAHSLSVLGEEPALILAYADQPYDEEAPDVEPFPFP